MKLRWAALCIGIFAVASCSGSSPGTVVEGQYASVSEMVGVLEEDGISCENLSVKDKEELEEERESRPEYTPHPGTVPIRAPEYDVHETGLCQFEGSPQIAGQEVASTLTVYENDEHLESIPEQGFPGIALVYGDNWLVQLSNLDLTERVSEALDGKVAPPLDTPFDDRDVAELGPRCFFIAALPPGLEAAAEQVGLSVADPDQFARVFAESAYYLPDERQASIEESCRMGLQMESAVGKDRDVLRTDKFEGFWMKVCAYTVGDPLTTQELGFTEGFSYKELGATLTERFLEPTSLTPTETRDLGRRCGAAVREGAIGDLD